MPLPLALGSHSAHGLAGGMNANLTAVKHLDTGDIEGMRRPGANHFNETRNSNAHQLALVALLLLFLPQSLVAHQVQCYFHGSIIVSAVVGPAEGRLIG